MVLEPTCKRRSDNSALHPPDSASDPELNCRFCKALTHEVLPEVHNGRSEMWVQDKQIDIVIESVVD